MLEHPYIDSLIDAEVEKELAEKPLPELSTLPFTGCKQCGGALVLIRGRYPQHDRREVCPTCLQEKLEQIESVLHRGQAMAQGGQSGG